MVGELEFHLATGAETRARGRDVDASYGLITWAYTEIAKEDDYEFDMFGDRET